MNVNGSVPPISLPPVSPGARPPRAPAPDAPDAPAAERATGSLWDVLTPEERAFFTEQAALGPLTYRSGGAVSEQPPAPTGQRIDVRG
jgi:hypothetical protein